MIPRVIAAVAGVFAATAVAAFVTVFRTPDDLFDVFDGLDD